MCSKLCDSLCISPDHTLICVTSVNQFKVCCVAGCAGGVCGLANVLGQEVCTLADLFHKGQMKEAEVLQQRLVAPNASVSIFFCCISKLELWGRHSGEGFCLSDHFCLFLL